MISSRNVIKIIIGNILLGLGYAKFLVPNKVINGGVTSLSLVIQQWLKIDLLWISNGLTLLLLLLCFVALNKEIFINSIVSSLSYMLCFSLWYKTPFVLTIHPIVDVFIASVLIAFGYYACLSSKASTAGLDVIALIIVKYTRYNLHVARVNRNLNFLVLGLGLFVFGVFSVLIGIIVSGK
ncbi:YitT family protein [Gracilibacillus alcaliphilus]|uniref:YitT family protein n=1 Tax=Gracilibacillus alcaliphilus TaxID=1401441 RepID=UPI00195C0ACF|nr:YitT family protein [Gracilibacillus alcaliphilus]MBM7679420.1 uncharacterized membrane-anchored protein YitT (DUF2179 family) [Gracilibacillus alcaliphilus]